MASVRSITLTLGLALVTSAAAAQTPAPELTAAQVSVACAPLPALGVVPSDAPYIMGNQDTVTRALVGDENGLVVNAGTDRGVQLNQRYFVRRIYRNADNLRSPEAHLVMTTGWVRIVAVNKTMSLATVDQTCSHILEGDFLEPFHAPVVPADLTVPETTGELDFKNYGRVMYGESQRWSAGTGDYMLIDRGADKSVNVGSHFAIYRDREVTGLPLTPIGEATVVSVGPKMSVVRITQSRDAVFTQDVVVPRGPARPGITGQAPGWQTTPAGTAGTSEATPGPEAPKGLLDVVATAIQELTTYSQLMADEKPRQAAGHLRAAHNIVRRLPHPKQDGQQGTPSEIWERPIIDSTTIATPNDRFALVNSAIRQLTEYGSLMNDRAPREADERLVAAKRSVERLQRLK
jgi:hypothetical protein